MRKLHKLVALATIVIVAIVLLSLVLYPKPIEEKKVEKILYHDINANEAYSLIKSGLNTTSMIVLDVRTWQEYNASHIKGGLYQNLEAINIPYDQLNANLSAYGTSSCPLTGHKDDLILVYCLAGKRSAIASSTLTNNSYVNFTNVQNMADGFQSYYLNTIGNPYQLNPVAFWDYSDTVVVNATGKPTYNVIFAKEAYFMITNGSDLYGSSKIVVDVRLSSSYNQSHIVNSTKPNSIAAISIPYVNGEELLSPLKEFKNEAIIIYCEGTLCSRSSFAAQFLADKGYTKIYVIDGGFDAWTLLGYPTSSSSSN